MIVIGSSSGLGPIGLIILGVVLWGLAIAVAISLFLVLLGLTWGGIVTLIDKIKGR